MKSAVLSVAALAGVANAAAPVITLDFEGAAYPNDPLVRKLDPSITHTHQLNYEQPDHTPVTGRQDFVQTCAACKPTDEGGDGCGTCPFPTAKAYDSVNGAITNVETRIYLVDDEDDVKNPPTLLSGPSDVNFKRRSKYLFKYDAKDQAGNRAEQVVFALTLDDVKLPEIALASTYYELEAGYPWHMPTTATATDNIDTEAVLTPQLLVDIHHEDVNGVVTSVANDQTQNQVMHLSSRFPYQQGIHKYTFTYKICDHAGTYGNNGANNCFTKVAGARVSDTQQPTITVLGELPTYHECATAYTDSGASVADHNDVENVQPGYVPITIVDTHSVVDPATINDYTVEYNAHDFAGNDATTKHRVVKVRDTTAPVQTLNSFMLHGELCNNVCRLKPRQIAADQGVIDDAGVTATDTCADDSSLVTTKAWNRPMDTTGKNLGSYIRTYSTRDPSNNVVHSERTFTIEDDEAPTLTIVGDPTETYESSLDTEYVDKGAACHDFVDGVLSHAVESSGANVNMRVPGIYPITYDCQDLSGNQATPVTRHVVVRDDTCPIVTINGDAIITIEAGFQYNDAHATATDDLDGDLTPHIVEDGNTVDDSGLFYHDRSCAEIMQEPGHTMSDGKYIITTWGEGKPRNEWKRTAVECHGEHTYLKVTGGSQSAYDERGDCADYGMQKLAYTSSMSLPYSIDTTNVLSSDDGISTSSDYICTAPYGPNVDVDTSVSDQTPTKGAQRGKYVITYTVVDAHGNGVGAGANGYIDCPTAVDKRTVVVKDTLAPVVSLHLSGKIIHISDAYDQGVNGEANPAAGNENPYLTGTGPSSRFNSHHGHDAAFSGMAEVPVQTSSAWIVGAVASAVTGFALLGYSRRAPTVTTVPV